MDVSQYLEIFIDETNGHLQTLSDSIMQLEKEPENKDVINEIFRAAHSLKGMAGTMGFKRMQHLTQCCHCRSTGCQHWIYNKYFTV